MRSGGVGGIGIWGKKRQGAQTRPRASVGNRALALSASATSAQTPAQTHPSALADNDALRARLIEIREQTRFLPDNVLAALDKIAPELAGWSAASQADLLAIKANGRMCQGRYDDAIVAKAQLTKSYVLFARADVDAAHQLAFEAEKLAMRTNNAAVRAQATITAGQTHAEQGNFTAALVKLQQAMAMRMLRRRWGGTPRQLAETVRLAAHCLYHWAVHVVRGRPA